MAYTADTSLRSSDLNSQGGQEIKLRTQSTEQYFSLREKLLQDEQAWAYCRIFPTGQLLAPSGADKTSTSPQARRWMGLSQHYLVIQTIGK
jgi:hypothetical protein